MTRVISTNFPKHSLPIMQRLGGHTSPHDTAYRGPIAVVSGLRVLAVCELVDCTRLHPAEKPQTLLHWWHLANWNVFDEATECAAVRPGAGSLGEKGWEPVCLNSYGQYELARVLAPPVEPPREPDMTEPEPLLAFAAEYEVPQLSLF